MPTVYLDTTDYRNAQVDLWQADHLARLNREAAPAPAPPEPAPATSFHEPMPQPTAAAQNGVPTPTVGPATEPVPAAVGAPVIPPNAPGEGAAIGTSAPSPPAPSVPDPSAAVDQWAKEKAVDAWAQDAAKDIATPPPSQPGASTTPSAPSAVPTPNAPVAPPDAISAPPVSAGQLATVAGPTPQGDDFQAYARQAAQRAGIDSDIFQRQIQQESGFNPTAQSPAGAQGIAQIVPQYHPGIDPSDPYASLDYAANLMATHLKNNGGDYSRALAAYNAGQGNVDRYGGVPPFEETQRYVSTILGSGQQAAGVGQPTALNRPSQFAMGLSDADAYAACGPAAAIAFARANGRNPTSSEAMQLAQQSGWTQAGGMNGVVNEKKLMDALGVPTKLETGAVNWSKVTSEAQGGNPVVISTPGHYFTVDDARTDASGATMYHVGTSGTDLKGGGEWMTAPDMQRAMGTANGALFADHPQASGPSLTENAAGVVRSVTPVVQQKAQDLLQAVTQIGHKLVEPNSTPFDLATGALRSGVQALGESPIGQWKAQNFPSVLDPGHPANVWTDLESKYGTPLMNLISHPEQMTPEDQQRANNVMLAAGGMTAGGSAGSWEWKGGKWWLKPGEPAAAVPPETPVPPRPGPATGPQLEPEVAATLPPGSGPLGAPAEPLPASTTTQGLQNMATARGMGADHPGNAGLPQPSSDVVTGLQNVARQRGILPTEPVEAYAGGAVQTPEQLGLKLRQLTAQVTGEVPPPPTLSSGKLPPNEALPTGRMPGQMPMDIGQPYQPEMLPDTAGGFAVPSPAPDTGASLARTRMAIEQQQGLGGVNPNATGVSATRRIGQQDVLPGVAMTAPVSPWDFLKAGRMGALAGGVQTMTHIVMNVPVQAGLKLASDVMATPEALGPAGYGAIQGIRSWALGAAQQLVAPGQLAEKMGGGTGARVVEAGLEGLVKTHGVLGDLAGQLVGNSELWRQAAIQAEHDGFSRLDVFAGKANDRIAELVANPTPAMRTAAEASAGRASLLSPLGTTGSALQDAFNSAPVLKLVEPFFVKGWNIAAQGQELLPTGMAGTAYDVARAAFGKGPYSGPAGFAGRGEAGAVTPLAERLRNHLIGLGLMAEAFTQAGAGNVTGDGPPDQQARQVLMDQGWRPDSVRIGGRYVDSHILGPVGWALTAGANAYEATHTSDQGGYMKPGATTWDVLGDVTAREGRYFTNETFLRGLGSTLQLVGSSAQQGKVGATEAASMLGSLVPQGALIANVATAQDPYQRKPQPGDISQDLAVRFPGARETVPERISRSGQPLPNPQQGLGVFLPRSSVGSPDPVLTFLSGSGVNLSAAPTAVTYAGKQIKLTPAEQQQIETTEGQRLQQSLSGYMNSQNFSNLPIDQRYKALQNVVNQARQYAEQRLIASIPTAERQARAAVAQRSTAGVLPYLAPAATTMARMVANQGEQTAAARHAALMQQLSQRPQPVGVSPAG